MTSECLIFDRVIVLIRGKRSTSVMEQHQLQLEDCQKDLSTEQQHIISADKRANFIKVGPEAHGTECDFTQS